MRKEVTVTVFVILILVVLSLLILVYVNSIFSKYEKPIAGQVVDCFPEYKCGDWSECRDEIQQRICRDIKCNSDEIVERRFCIECKTNIECKSWSKCSYLEKVNDIIAGKLRFEGYQERECIDLNNCVSNFVEEQSCQDEFPLEFIKRIQCKKEFLVAVDPLSKQELVNIDLESYKIGKLNIVFVQGKQFYCPECYNGILDNSEESVDCGGDCKPCK